MFNIYFFVLINAKYFVLVSLVECSISVPGTYELSLSLSISVVSLRLYHYISGYDKLWSLTGPVQLHDVHHVVCVISL